MLKYSVLKDECAKSIIRMVTPFRENRVYLAENKEKVLGEVFESSKIIRYRAQETVREVSKIVGLFSPFSI